MRECGPLHVKNFLISSQKQSTAGFKLISFNRIGNYKLLVGNPGAGDWTPPPEGLSTIPTQVNSIQSSTTPLVTSTSSILLPRSRENHPNSLHVLEKLDSSEQISLTERTTLMTTTTNPSRLTHQKETTITMKDLPPQKPVDPEKLSDYNHKYSENSIFYHQRDHDLDDNMNPSVSAVEQSEVLESHTGSKSSNKKPLSLSGSEEDNIFQGANIYPDNGNGVDVEYFADDNDTLVTSCVNDTHNVVAEYWTRVFTHENISNIFRKSYIDQQQNKTIKLSHNISASDGINDTDVWNSTSESYDHSWERLNPGNGEREAEVSESGHIGDTTFMSENFTDEEQIHQLMMVLGRDKSDLWLYNLAGEFM